ncbi:DNA polymerase III subunit epsilon [Saezia sanguinis]|uniref:DNA polymerase III subunit epsilon n=1 Tax=Saezia sanguinis TaxID=1965230 RepID=UPI0030668F10
MRQIVLDTETTGLNPQTGDRILEIGCVEVLNRRLTGNDRHYYINPERESHEDALKVHGITSEFLKDKPLFKDIVNDLLEYLQGSELIIHNAAFDVAFMNKEFELLGLPPIEKLDVRVTDSLAMARELFPGKRNSLDALCDRLGVDNSNRTLHGALLDAQLLADVYINMTRGQHALVIDDSGDYSGTTGHGNPNAADLSAITFPVIIATPEELQAHQKVLEEIGKESGGKVQWGLASSPSAVS